MFQQKIDIERLINNFKRLHTFKSSLSSYPVTNTMQDIIDRINRLKFRYSYYNDQDVNDSDGYILASIIKESDVLTELIKGF